MKDNERQEIEKFGQLQENGILMMTIVGEDRRSSAICTKCKNNKI